MVEQSVIDAIRQHASQEYPREACGLIVIRHGRQRYFPCQNVAQGNDHFIISGRDYARIADLHEITYIVHSHPDEAAQLSEADRLQAEQHGVQWLVYSYPEGYFVEHTPDSYIPPLVGRTFEHGITDCYSLVCDYYRRTLQLELPPFVREDEWWKYGQNLYLENFEKAGFVEIPLSELRKHDALLMQIRSPVPNHAAIYLDDDLILHHLYGMLSSRDAYSALFRTATVKAVRHRSLFHA